MVHTFIKRKAWTHDVAFGGVYLIRIGRCHVTTIAPLALHCESRKSFAELVALTLAVEDLVVLEGGAC